VGLLNFSLQSNTKLSHFCLVIWLMPSSNQSSRPAHRLERSRHQDVGEALRRRGAGADGNQPSPLLGRANRAAQRAARRHTGRTQHRPCGEACRWRNSVSWPGNSMGPAAPRHARRPRLKPPNSPRRMHRRGKVARRPLAGATLKRAATELGVQGLLQRVVSPSRKPSATFGATASSRRHTNISRAR